MARILTKFGPKRSQRPKLFDEKKLNERNERKVSEKFEKLSKTFSKNSQNRYFRRHWLSRNAVSLFFSQVVARERPAVLPGVLTSSIKVVSSPWTFIAYRRFLVDFWQNRFLNFFEFVFGFFSKKKIGKIFDRTPNDCRTTSERVPNDPRMTLERPRTTPIDPRTIPERPRMNPRTIPERPLNDPKWPPNDPRGSEIF